MLLCCHKVNDDLYKATVLSQYLMQFLKLLYTTSSQKIWHGLKIFWLIEFQPEINYAVIAGITMERDAK